MAAPEIRIVLLVAVLSCTTGQKYFVGEEHPDDYFPTAPITYYQQNPGNYFLPKDLQTSELPSHLQQTLPQYQHYVAPKQNVPFPFRLASNDYVIPSTHRPDYSRVVLPQQQTLNGEQENRLEFVSRDTARQIFSNKKIESNINPIQNENKAGTKQVDLHFNKRDSEDEEIGEDLGEEEEYLDEREEEVKNKSDEELSKAKTVAEKGKNDVPEEEDYEEEYEYEDEDVKDPTELDELKQSTRNESSAVLTTTEPLRHESEESENSPNPETSQSIVEVPSGGNISKNNDDMPEYVVSVVTSKTVVNNTIISPVNVEETTLEPEQGNTTDSWIVIASVQTSRSISGARYIPSSSVDQDERRELLNEAPNAPTEPIAPENSTIFSTTLPTSTQTKASTESLTDKLDSIQSDLSGIIIDGFKNDNIAVIEENLSTKVDTTTLSSSSSATAQKPSAKLYPQVNIRKYNPGSRGFRHNPKKSEAKSKPTSKPEVPESTLKSKDPLKGILDKIKPADDLISSLLPPGYKLNTTTETVNSNNSGASSVLKTTTQIDDVSALSPPGYKDTTDAALVNDILSKAKRVNDLSGLLPPGYQPSITAPKIKPVKDLSGLLPPGYKSPSPEVAVKNETIKGSYKPSSSTEKSVNNLLSKAKKVEDLSGLLPPGYKPSSSAEKGVSSILSKAKPITDISALLPPGYNKKEKSSEKSVASILSKARPDELSDALLPPDFKKGFSKPKATTSSSIGLQTVTQNIPLDLLPPGYKLPDATTESSSKTTMPTATMSPSISTTTAGSAFKVVFPSRPGGGTRKTTRTTTSKPQNEQANKPSSPTIQKGWPTRASTEFSGWPTPSTTPISIEKLLEAARAAASSSSTETVTETTSTTTTTTTTTTTPRPTTPGLCAEECDLAGTIKLVGGAKWVPELLDPNTKEYQMLANSVQGELESIYNNSPLLKRWYTKIRIDGFSEGSILVDYLVEFNEVGKKINTQEIKKLFHESLADIANKSSNREGKSLNESRAERFSLGEFEVDPKYTDFIVIPKQSYPTVGYADDVLLPQWAIAVIVIGLASLLFVIIFGVTVLFNRHKNSKKTPAPLTEDMLNELNKNHMGGFDNYGVDDFYNMEDVWSDKNYDQKPPKKRHNASSSLYDNSTTNLYDSWRSQWNGQWSAYNNTYYGHPSSQHSGHSGFRRPDHDTNF